MRRDFGLSAKSRLSAYDDRDVVAPVFACTLSSAFAAFPARGASLDEAAIRAKRYIAEAIAAGARYRIGHGHGLVMHFYNYREQDSAPSGK